MPCVSGWRPRARSVPLCRSDRPREPRLLRTSLWRGRRRWSGRSRPGGSAFDRSGGDRAGLFSRGLRQRLALERALVHRPRLVLLDEPFTGLDDASAALLLGRLRDLRGRGAIVVMATHDFDMAEGLVDHAVCLTSGRMSPMAADSRSLRERYRQAVAEAGRADVGCAGPGRSPARISWSRFAAAK